MQAVLWHDAKGDWQKAHAQVDHLDDQNAAWVHAYLHRKEGDISNAGLLVPQSTSKPSRRFLSRRAGANNDRFDPLNAQQ